MKLITLEDMEDCEPKENWSLFHLLVDVAKKGLEVLEDEKKSSTEHPKQSAGSPFSSSSSSSSSIREKGKEFVLSEERRLFLINAIFKKPDNDDEDEDSSIKISTKDSEFLVGKSEDSPSKNLVLGNNSDRRRKRNSENSSTSEEETEENKKKKPNRSFAPNNRNPKEMDGPKPPPPLPESFKNAILRVAEGKPVSKEKLIIQKIITPTDLSRGHNRFAIPFKQIHEEFLTDEEAKFLANRGKKLVVLIEPSTETCMVKFTRWNMRKEGGGLSSYYVLNGTWNEIHKRNRLKPGMISQLWAVRIEQELCLALVILSSTSWGGGKEAEIHGEEQVKEVVESQN